MEKWKLLCMGLGSRVLVPTNPGRHDTRAVDSARLATAS